MRSHTRHPSSLAGPLASPALRLLLRLHYGAAGKPINGVRTGTAKPINSVTVSLPKLLTQTFPDGSIPTAKACSNDPDVNPRGGDNAIPG